MKQRYELIGNYKPGDDKILSLGNTTVLPVATVTDRSKFGRKLFKNTKCNKNHVVYITEMDKVKIKQFCKMNGYQSRINIPELRATVKAGDQVGYIKKWFGSLYIFFKDRSIVKITDDRDIKSKARELRINAKNYCNNIDDHIVNELRSSIVKALLN